MAIIKLYDNVHLTTEEFLRFLEDNARPTYKIKINISSISDNNVYIKSCIINHNTEEVILSVIV